MYALTLGGLHGMNARASIFILHEITVDARKGGIILKNEMKLQQQ